MMDGRRFVPPLGWPMKFRVATVAAAERGRFFVWNRYPGQVIGFCVRLPDLDLTGLQRAVHPRLSLVWARPARWWR